MKGFTPVPDVLLDKYGFYTAAIYGAIYRYCQMEKQRCDAAVETIAKRVGLTRRTAHKYMKPLLDDGYIIDLTPDYTHKPHQYICSDKLDKEEAICYTQGVQILHTTESEGVQIMQDRCANNVTDGVQDLHTKKVVKDTFKETTTKDKSLINKALPPHSHLDLKGKKVWFDDDSDVLIGAVVIDPTPKLVNVTLLDTGELKTRIKPDRLYIENGGSPELSPIIEGKKEHALTPDESAMYKRLVDLFSISSFPDEKAKYPGFKKCKDFAKYLVGRGRETSDIDDFEKWYRSVNWKGKKADAAISYKQFNELWTDFGHWKDNGGNENASNIGHNKQSEAAERNRQANAKQTTYFHVESGTIRDSTTHAVIPQ